MISLFKAANEMERLEDFFERQAEAETAQPERRSHRLLAGRQPHLRFGHVERAHRDPAACHRVDEASLAREIFARALNLFDRQYEEVLGYPAPGRTAYVGARFAVGR